MFLNRMIQAAMIPALHEIHMEFRSQQQNVWTCSVARSFILLKILLFRAYAFMLKQQIKSFVWTNPDDDTLVVETCSEYDEQRLGVSYLVILHKGFQVNDDYTNEELEFIVFIYILVQGSYFSVSRVKCTMKLRSINSQQILTQKFFRYLIYNLSEKDTVQKFQEIR